PREIRGRLLQAFSEPQADLLSQVLIESHTELVTRADFHQLTEVVHELAEAQKRTEERVEDLTKSQHEMQGSIRGLQVSQAAMQESQRQPLRGVEVSAGREEGARNPSRR
ncbi:MAG: hypothetical protein ACKO6E_10235, partial [Planctomycetota bacterium]